MGLIFVGVAYPRKLVPNENFHVYDNLFLPLAPDYTEHIYSAVNKSRKAATRASHGRSGTNDQVVAVYDSATAVKQEDSAL